MQSILLGISDGEGRGCVVCRLAELIWDLYLGGENATLAPYRPFGPLVMDGVVIESDVLLAAGSLVAPGKVLESGYLYQGRPARRVRALTEAELNKLRTGAAHYVTLKNAYIDPSNSV